MNNLFDSDNYPDSEPDSLVLGSRWAWKRSDITEAYPTATYTLKYVLAIQADTGEHFTITASKVSAAHVVEVPIASTTNKAIGEYFWQSVVIRDSDSEELVVDSGFIEIKAQTGEVRSHVYKTLMAIRATIEGKAGTDQLSYSINGRSLSRYPIVDLIDFEKRYAQLWKQEKQKLDRENGRAGRHKVLTKMGA